MKPMGVVLGICKWVLVRVVCPAASGTLGGDSSPLWSPSGVVSPLCSTGWSSECLLEWDSFTSLAIPSMLMMCIEWWTYEIGSFLIGQRGGGLPGCDGAPQAARGLRQHFWGCLNLVLSPPAPRAAERGGALGAVHHLRGVRRRLHGKGWGF